MTAVDHAELKRLAEGATPGKWIASVSGLPEWRNVEYFVESDHPGVNEGDTLVCTTNAPDSRDAAFIASANPAVVLALLSEIEGLKAERDALIAVDEAGEGLRQASRDRTYEAERQLAALRTQAPDSWRPIETAPKDGDAILITRPTLFTAEERWHVVRWDEGDEMWVCHDGKFDSYLRGPAPTHWMPLPAAPALRPQTAESGK